MPGMSPPLHLWRAGRTRSRYAAPAPVQARARLSTSGLYAPSALAKPQLTAGSWLGGMAPLRGPRGRSAASATLLEGAVDGRLSRCIRDPAVPGRDRGGLAAAENCKRRRGRDKKSGRASGLLIVRAEGGNSRPSRPGALRGPLLRPSRPICASGPQKETAVAPARCAASPSIGRQAQERTRALRKLTDRSRRFLVENKTKSPAAAPCCLPASGPSLF